MVIPPPLVPKFGIPDISMRLLNTDSKNNKINNNSINYLTQTQAYNQRMTPIPYPTQYPTPYPTTYPTTYPTSHPSTHQMYTQYPLRQLSIPTMTSTYYNYSMMQQQYIPYHNYPPTNNNSNNGLYKPPNKKQRIK